jgi:hypothetical protein
MTRRRLLLLLLLVPVAAEAGTRRYAVAIGASEGLSGEQHLLYADRDAQRIAGILRDTGGFAPEDVLVLAGVAAEDVRRALIGINARLRADAAPAMLFVFYSGHGDAEALHLRGTRLPLAELRDLVTGSPAGVRVLVLDACRAGAMTRVKGGRPGPAFRVDVDDRLDAEGVAILASSAAGEDSQESDQLGASFFTHYLASALIGAADRNGDGKVTLGESFTWASERTLAATAATIGGPQHPTYRWDLGGRSDVVLTRPFTAGSLGTLEVEPGSYLVHERAAEGPVVAEVASTQAARIGLSPGGYFVSRRADDHLLEGVFRVEAGRTTRVDPVLMRRLDYARVVRKGGTALRSTLQVFTQVGVRGSLLDLGPAVRAEVGTRLDLSDLSLQLRVAAGGSDVDGVRLAIGTREVAASLAVLRDFDLGPVTLGAGVEGGGSLLSQRFHELRTPDRDGGAAFVGPTAEAELRAFGPIALRADGTLLTYFLRGGNDPAHAAGRTPVTWRAALGASLTF